MEKSPILEYINLDRSPSETYTISYPLLCNILYSKLYITRWMRKLDSKLTLMRSCFFGNLSIVGHYCHIYSVHYMPCLVVDSR